MQTFTIRDIENLTGIKAHTLRIWEHRYSFFKPKRKQSQHRFYDNEDLKSLLRISFLYHLGWKVSTIATMSSNQIIDEIQKADVSGRHLQLVSAMIEAAVDFDEAGFVSIINELTEKIGFERCVTEVCYPYLKKIGLLWSTNNVIPAQEHFTSYIVQNKIIAETAKLPVTEQQPTILLLCPKGEFHELPLLFIHYLLRKYGWSTLYLGINSSLNEVQKVNEVHNIPYIYLHLITNFTGQIIDNYLSDFCNQFPDKKILASGAGFQSLTRSYENLQVLQNEEEIYTFITIKSDERGF